MLYFFRAFMVSLYNFIGFDEAVKLFLQLVVLLRQNTLMAVKLFTLPPKVIMPLHKGFVAIFKALDVSAEAFYVLIQLLNVLISYLCALIQLLAFDFHFFF